MSSDKTSVAIQIGNSDDKLPQIVWAEFIRSLERYIINTPGTSIHFAGGSEATRAWQNYCFVLEIPTTLVNELQHFLAVMCKKYGQDLIAFMSGYTDFIGPISESLRDRYGVR